MISITRKMLRSAKDLKLINLANISLGCRDNRHSKHLCKSCFGKQLESTILHMIWRRQSHNQLLYDLEFILGDKRDLIRSLTNAPRNSRLTDQDQNKNVYFFFIRLLASV